MWTQELAECMGSWEEDHFTLYLYLAVLPEYDIFYWWHGI